MPRLPTLKARDVIRALEKARFSVVRQKGSHAFLQDPDGHTTVVPLHPGRDIDRALLQKIISDTGMTQQEFLKLV
jgi:predicted RNA binding protein YcfA (HicA-like mRNA interferase family)